RGAAAHPGHSGGPGAARHPGRLAPRAVLEGGASAQAGRPRAPRALPARGRPVRGLTAATILLAMAVSPAAAAALEAGVASVEVVLPAGTPLAGYGGFPRRAWMPDLLGSRPYAFWFRPSTGVHDPIRARALVLTSGATQILWLAVDTIGIDPTLVTDLRQRLAARGSAPTLVLSASHTHSGPGAYSESSLFGFLALDRLAPEVRARLLDGMEAAAREAERRREPARAITGLAPLASQVTRVRLPRPALSARNCLAGWAPGFVRIGLGSALPTSSELLAFRIGDGAWVTVPGELQTRLGLDIKKEGRRHFARVFVAGYTNDYLGYFL